MIASNKGIFNFSKLQYKNTTLLAIKSQNFNLLMTDGQVSLGSQIMKTNANKIYTVKPNLHIGFAGSVSDAHYLIKQLEPFLENTNDMLKACVDFSMLWRTGKILRQLEASLLVVGESIVELDGSGNVMEVNEVRGVGSGGIFVESAAKGILDYRKL